MPKRVVVDVSDDDDSPKKKGRYNLRAKKSTVWVPDDTLTISDESSEEEEYEDVPFELTDSEQAYYDKLARPQQNALLTVMRHISNLSLGEKIPYKFRVMSLPISDYTKLSVVQKIMNLDEEGNVKIRTWLDAFFRIPFGNMIPLPIQYSDGQEKCTEFMVSAQKRMDENIYGMLPAKTQIMQMLAQWIVNPESVGNDIAFHGPMGVGKTSLARNAIASVLNRPIEFFSLGGATDIANYIGHSFTYEGSIWGRIVDSLMRSKCMNPVLYFDELDKVSGTAHGDEIIAMLIHLTDRSQNSQFHDRYFAGIDFDLSRCLFVFSFNDIEKVHPILRDRMTVINCEGYTETDKKVIMKDYIWPNLLRRLKFQTSDLILEEKTLEFLISEYSSKEKGVRSLIRATEDIISRLNMLRIAKHKSMETYSFYFDAVFPLTITESIVRKLLNDETRKEPEAWRSMYN